MFAIEMAPWGGAAISEVDQVGQRLRDRQGDNEAWWSEWVAMARRIEAKAAQAALLHGAHFRGDPHAARRAEALLAGCRALHPGL